MPLFGQGYEHINDAAAAALMMIARQPGATGREFAPLLVRNPQGLIQRSQMAIGNETGATVDPALAGGNPIVGLAHNHPSGSPIFSPADVAASRFGPVFLRPMGGGSPDQKFTPGESETMRLVGVDEPVGVGDPFLAQFPIEEFLQLIGRDNPLVNALISESQRFNPTSRPQVQLRPMPEGPRRAR